ncbi:oligosaccharide flippase family protein [Chelativorans alearense]|uniref:oligosaccharide flippase family protein n=1 Tax=Chelativorans alearense TaxID=2681495 RepID=UPI0013D0FB71|nr:oligosaccharide flippase family protein [Chelativorans alearense]
MVFEKAIESARRFGVLGSDWSLIGGGVWIAFSKAASQLAQLATIFVAARFLSPTEFGTFAFTSAIGIFLVVLAEGGWAEFIMKSSDDRERFDQVSTIALISGFIFTALGMATSAVVYFEFSHWHGLLLGLLCFCILPAALTTAYHGTLVCRGELRKQAMIRVTAEATGIVATIFALLAGLNVFGLVAGRIIIQVIVLIGTARAVDRMPRLVLSHSSMTEVLAFSQHILANRLIVFLWSYSGTLAVGGFLGMAEAGYYRAAERVVAAISELVGEPARALGWVVFKRANEQAHNDGHESRAGANGRFLVTLLALAAPVYLGLALVSEDVIYFALGENWMPAAVVVSILCLKQLILTPGYITEPLLSVAGNVHKRLPITILNMAVALTLVVIFAPFGLIPLALGQVLGAGFALITTIKLQISYGGVNWYGVARNAAATALWPLMVMVFVVLAIENVLGSHTFNRGAVFLLEVLAGASAYGLCVLIAVKLLRESRRVTAA